MDQEPLFNQECPEELYNQQDCSCKIVRGKPVKIHKYRVNIPSKDKKRNTFILNKAQPLKHPLDDTLNETNSDDGNCSEDEYDSLDDVSYSSCSTSSDQFREPHLLQNSWYSSSYRNNSCIGNSISSNRSGISLLSLNGTTFPPSSLASTPSTTTALLTTISSTISLSNFIEGDTNTTTPYLTPSSSPLSTFVSFEATSKPEIAKSSKLHRTTSADCLNKVLSKYQPKQSLYSNLTISMKSLRDKLITRALSDLEVEAPSIVDEEVPPVITKELPSQELITFFEAKHDHDTTQEHIKLSFRNRDHRINSQFLRLYAYDYNARIYSRTLPNSLSQEELISIILDNPHLKSFHKKHNIYHISNLSREKLWNSVVLKPRLDKSPQQSIDYEDYICVADDTVITHASITRKHSKYLPWDLKPSIKPAGVLPGGKWEFNGKAPSLGISKTQFTVKGWCNSRWVAKTE